MNIILDILYNEYAIGIRSSSKHTRAVWEEVLGDRVREVCVWRKGTTVAAAGFLVIDRNGRSGA